MAERIVLCEAVKCLLKVEGTVSCRVLQIVDHGHAPPISARDRAVLPADAVSGKNGRAG
jgi:hypothetical protein